MRANFVQWMCACAIVVLASCGGSAGSNPAETKAPLRQAALAGEALLDWAEAQYAALFPGHHATQTVTVGGVTYHYRSYAGGNYTGYGDNGAVYVLGPQITGGAIVQYGLITDYTCLVSPASCNSIGTVTGTAAAGGPIAAATVTVVDSMGTTRTTTTSSNGGFSVNASGLAAPLLLRVAASGKTFYGVTVDTGTLVNANLTPFTDLIVRSWYGVQGVGVDAAFASPSSHPPPANLQARAVSQAVLQMAKLSFVVANAGIVQALDILDMPFAANHAGLDAVLDATSTSVVASGATLAIAGAGLQQSTSVTYDTVRNSITAVTTTTGPHGASSSSTTSVIPVTAAQVAAWSGIENSLASFAGVVNAKGPALAASDLYAFLDTNLLMNGLDRDQLAANAVSTFNSGGSISFLLQTMESLDLAAGHARVNLLGSQTVQQATQTQEIEFDMALLNGTWVISGNGQFADVKLHAEARINQGGFTGNSGIDINVDVEAPKGSLVGATVQPSSGPTVTMTAGATVIDDSGLQLDHWFYNSGAMAASSVPPAGTLFSFVLYRAQGGVSTVQLPVNAITTETAPITNLAGSTLADAHLGGSLQVGWQLPVTYAIAQVKLSALTFTSTQESNPGTFQCETQVPAIGVAQSSATINIPATCNGQPVKAVNLNLSVIGINGERSQTIYTFQ